MPRAYRHHDGDLPLLRWSPPPKLLPFPTHRREDFVRRNAQRMVEMRPDRAEAHLDRTLDAMADRLCRLGLDPVLVEIDMAAARVAVMSRYTALGGGGAR